jgi:sugar lactone lactonase YvrE
MLLPLTLALLSSLGCRSGDKVEVDDTGTVDTADTADTGDTGTVDTGWTRPEECESLPELPLDYSTLRGFSGAEDFAFGADGGLVSVDFNGNLTSVQQDGSKTVIAPGLGETAGTAYLPNGNLIVADAARGTLVRVAPNGGSEVLFSGLSYPNGVAVSAEGMIYVADQDTGILWEVDGESGEGTQLATDLFAPNGVAIGEGGSLFVGSFGGGTVHTIPKVDGVFGAATEIGSVLDNSSLGCEAEADYCVTGSYALGQCDAELVCKPLRDTQACEDKSAGDACSTELFGAAIESACRGTELFCPYTPLSHIEPCAGKGDGANCTVQGKSGQCYGTAQNVKACYSWDGGGNSSCEGLTVGEACQQADTHYPYVGSCVSYGGPRLECEAPFGGDEGGLDGIAVDACDNVYVTEYIAGKIWRFEPGESEAEEVVKLPSSWIPNMHFGHDIGGWSSDTLYIMDRDEGRVFGLELGVGGRFPTIVPESE